jgi:hypothetical protein
VEGIARLAKPDTAAGAAAKTDMGCSAAAVAASVAAEMKERRLVMATPRGKECPAMMLEPGGNFRMLQDAGSTAYLDGLPAEFFLRAGRS